jgi:hypothetical protein
MSLGSLGAFTATANGLAYVALADAGPGPRGPQPAPPASASALWFWDIAGGERAQLAEADSLISDLER